MIPVLVSAVADFIRRIDTWTWMNSFQMKKGRNGSCPSQILNGERNLPLESCNIEKHITICFSGLDTHHWNAGTSTNEIISDLVENMFEPSWALPHHCCQSSVHCRTAVWFPGIHFQRLFQPLRMFPLYYHPDLKKNVFAYVIMFITSLWRRSANVASVEKKTLPMAREIPCETSENVTNWFQMAFYISRLTSRELRGTILDIKSHSVVWDQLQKLTAALEKRHPYLVPHQPNEGSSLVSRCLLNPIWSAMMT